MIIYQLTKLPDFNTAKYMALHGNDVRSKVMEAQQAFLMLLHSMEAEETDVGVSLRYVYDPERPPGTRLQIFLLIRNELGIEDAELARIVENSPFGIFYPFSQNAGSGLWHRVDEDTVGDVVSPENYGIAVEITKEEAQFDPMFNKQDPALAESIFNHVPYYTVYPFEPDGDNDMTFLDRMFHSFERRAMVEITVSPTMISKEETAALTLVLGKLEEVTSSGSISINTSIHSSGSTTRDALAEMVQDQLKELQETVFAERFFDFGLRVYTDDETYAAALSDRLAIAGNVNGRYRRFLYRQAEEGFNEIIRASTNIQPEANIRWPDYWDEIPESYGTLFKLKRLAKLAHIEEIAPFFRMMVPCIEPLQTIPLETETAIDEEKETLFVGRDSFKSHRQVEIELEQLKKHLFVAGVPGSGKSTAVLNLLYQLYLYDIPFLVIEPAKTEYRLLKRLASMSDKDVDPDAIDMGRAMGEDLRVYTVGEDIVSPFRFNPFEFPEGIGLFEHVSNIEACFKGALPISTGPLPALINEAVDEIYKDRGWKGDDLADGSKAFPTMNDLYEKISEIMEAKDYSSDVKGDLKTAIEVRIGSLLRRNIGRIFDTDVSRPSIEELVNQPVVLELDYLNEEQANLMTMFVLSRIREYVRATRTSKSDLAHVIVLEEAHNIIGKGGDGSGDDQANPKAEATKYIAQFLAEMRAMGEGLIIADQLPSAVAPEVVKNTNIKLIHRLVSGDDREDIGMTMLMDPVQMEDLARLMPGEAYLYQEGMHKPARVSEVYIASTFPVLAEAPPSQEELIALLQQEEWWQDSIFSGVRPIGSGYLELYGEMDRAFNRLLMKAKKAAMNLSDLGVFSDLRLEFDGICKAFAKKHAALDEKAASFFQQMYRRSDRCAAKAELQCRKLLTEAPASIRTQWGKFDDLSLRLKEWRDQAEDRKDKEFDDESSE